MKQISTIFTNEVQFIIYTMLLEKLSDTYILVSVPLSEKKISISSQKPVKSRSISIPILWEVLA